MSLSSKSVRRLQKVRDFIALLPKKACYMPVWQDLASDKDGESFTFKAMKKKGFACGTAACIGGWTEMMVNKRTEEEGSDAYGTRDSSYINATDYLGLDSVEADYLFNLFPSRVEKGNWKKWILRRLDGIIADGEVRLWTDQMSKESAARRRKAAKTAS